MLGLGLSIPQVAARGSRSLVAAIRSLFAANEPGVWYDPSDLSTLYQDAAGTVPVTAVEQPVGRILDKSGRGFHATQATATSRPVLRQDGSGKHYLYFDGVDDWLVTNTITPGTDKVQVFAGVRKLTESGYQVIAELSSNVANNGSFLLQGANISFAPNENYKFVSKGTILSNGARIPSGFAAPITNILTALGDISVDSAILRINGTQVASSTTDQGAGNYLAYPLYIGRRNGTTFPFNGHLYSLIVRFGSNLPAATIENTEKYINAKTRAY